MANLICDNVYTTSFTPREYQIELLDAAKDRNTIICLSKPSTKTFISVKLIHEFVYESAEGTRGLKYSVYVTGQENVSNMYACVKHLTDLKVAECKDIREFSTYQLNAIQCFVTTADVLVELLSCNIIKLSYVNLLVIDECHKAINDSAVQYIMSEYSHLLENTKPRIVGLASRLFQAGDSPAMLRKTLETLEKILHSKAETASDVVTLLRYSLRPYEIFVECGRPIPNSLQDTLMMYVFRARCFLDDHRFDPYEMYQDEFREDLQKIPDPKIDPHIIFDDFLDVVDTLGCWPANRAALALLIKIEKLKVKTPYERHFLLLCMTSTVMVEIRCICEEAFQDLSETERIMLFSAPKILRLIELIKQFKPESSTSEIKSEMNCLQESKVNCVDFSQLIDNEININKDSNPIESENKNKTDDKTNGISIEFANETDIIEGIHAHLKKLRNTMNIGDLTSLDLLNGKLSDNNSTIELDVSSNINTNTEKYLNKLEIDKNGVLPIDNWDGIQSDEELEEIKTNKLAYFKHKDASFPDEYFYGTQSRDSYGFSPKRNDVFQTTDSRGQGRRRHRGISRKIGNFTKQLTENDTLCGIIFVQKAFTAKILFFALVELSRNDPDYAFISAQFTVDKTADPIINIREAEREHRTQEEVLRKFRTHECNLLVATSVLEEGIDLPKCNLVIHFDPPMTYRSYVQCKSRARAPGAYHVFLLDLHDKEDSVNRIARYYEIEKILLSKCADMEPTEAEHRESDKFNICVAPYRTLPTIDAPFVDTLSAVALVNKYCAKLPSDTFTKLAPIWTEDIINDEEEKLYRCKLRLPINSPVKEEIIGPLMKNRVLARRVAALRTCRVLHEAGELDDQLQPIGKEGFRASESDWDDFPLDADDEMLAKDSSEPRPGTTKRRQYYYKRIAESLTNCKPLENEPAYLYSIDMILTCPLPEEQNTRGRRIYPPEESPQGFGILTSKRIPKICSFPIFTRSGEVGVQLKQCDIKVILNSERSRKVCVFLNYVFTSVLRLQKYLMVFDPNDSENSYFIVPTMTCNGNVSVDWNFLDKIDENKDLRPSVVSQEDRKDFIFEPAKYHDAVVMPWYRNQDQPQYFYVAEICDHLSPKSSFPGTDYSTFEDYYFKKYDIKVQNTKQPLLDVDHTSARLNFLTPRYVNRKGVALPTSSEETKRAKRENLEQKQILVPELCTVHPFPASLWRKAVCLPCILYRVNALLLADEIRKRVAQDLALGTENLKLDFDWPRLDFGWNLADVFRKVKQDKQALPNPSSDIKSMTVEVNSEIREKENNALEQDKSEESDNSTKKDKDWMEIGTWSNDMAETFDNDSTKSDDFCRIRYGSPTMRPYNSLDDNYYDWDSDDSYTSEIDSSEDSQKGNGLRIEFKGDNVAEAIEDDRESSSEPKLLMLTESSMNYSDYYSDWTPEQINDNDLEDRVVLENHKHRIISSNYYFDIDEKILIERKSKNICEPETLQQHEVQEPLVVEPLIKSNQETKMKGREICKIDNSSVDAHTNFSFDFQPNLTEHPGPSPSIILQALTMSNANDGINLERLETIGDSFLKYAITTYLYCTYENVHEGKLSHLRSKQVSNLNLYRLGRRKILGESMIATKFEPHDNWLPPCYYVPSESEEAFSEDTKQVSDDEIQEEGDPLFENSKALSCFIPYNLLTQHSIPDKSIADCVEALIGAYLIECGPRGALLFMAWLGIRVLPLEYRTWKDKQLEPVPLRPPGSTISEIMPDGSFKQIVYGILRAPQSPLLRHVRDPEEELSRLLQGYNEFEHTIDYHFRDRSYLLQALTHTSYFPNRLTDCYQRLEFLGDAILDYLITRHLYEDSRQHSPGALTDLRSALVNNTIFASLAVRFGFHKYFRHLSPGLHEVMSRFVRIQESNGHTITEEYCMIEQDESEEAEDVEVPKALGDVFESVAGAVFLDSGMSLDAVWKVYYRMMRTEIELFSMNVPKSPIRELLELEPETTKFSKSEKLADGKRVRVSVEVFGKGIFKGIGRNYRIAKCTAAKCALKHLKKRGLVCRNNYVSSAYS